MEESTLWIVRQMHSDVEAEKHTGTQSTLISKLLLFKI